MGYYHWMKKGTKMTSRQYEEKINELEELLAKRAQEGQRAVGLANRTMDLLDRVLEKMDGFIGHDETVFDMIKQIQIERKRGGILLPRDCKYLDKYGISRFNP